FSLDRKDSALSKLQSEILATNGKLRAELAGDVEKVSKEFSLDNPNGALTRLVKQMDQAQKTITKEFSLDHDGSALQKLAGLLEKTNTAVETSLTLDDEASPLARLRREMLEVLEQHRAANDEFRTQVYAVLEKDKTKREQAARTTLHGHTFEEKVGELLEIAAKGAGDIYEATGQIHGRTQRKRGDHVIELGPDSAAEGACIVCEAKSQKNYTLKDARNEIAEARENRDAEVGLFVFDRKRAPEKLRPLFRIGNDVFVVWDDEDEATDVYLNVAFDLARALARHVREEDSEVEADFAAIDKMLLDLAKHADSLEAIAKAARSVRKNGESILETADAMREALERQVQSLQRSIDALRDADGE
ncbi:MAG: hypothetical protein ACREJX_16710, partial [Polyangiaceae bacterium]